MFVLFGELRKKQSITKVKDYGIGLGLNCSQQLCRALGGDIKLIKSDPNQTQFQIKLPLNNKAESKQILDRQKNIKIVKSKSNESFNDRISSYQSEEDNVQKPI